MVGMTLQPLRNVARTHLQDAPDLRGWTAFARDGEALGAVSNVIVDGDAAAPAYLNVVPFDERGAPSECWIRIPFSEVVVDEDERRVVLSDIALLGLGTGSMGLTSAFWR
jgi:hypothetical protein